MENSSFKDFLFKFKKLVIALFVLTTAFILIGMLYPSEKLAEINIWDYDKIAHYILFAVWTFLYGVVRAIRKKRAPNLWLVFILGLTYGLLVEILQFIFPTNRSPELWDFIADALGSLSAVLILRWLFRVPHQK